MSDLKETQISSKKIFSGRLINLYFDQVKLPNGGPAHANGLTIQGLFALFPF